MRCPSRRRPLLDLGPQIAEYCGIVDGVEIVQQGFDHIRQALSQHTAESSD